MGDKPSLKEQAIAALRFVVLVFVSASLFTFVLIFASRGTTKQQQEVANTLLRTNLAQTCVLVLPVDPLKGRDPELVKLCFTQYNLQPPITHSEGSG